VFARIHEAGGIASLAHPGLLARDAWIPELAESGLDAIEVYYTAHDAPTTERYLAMAQQLGLAASGGSDYHADDSHAAKPGAVSLPRKAYESLLARLKPRAMSPDSRTSAIG
jgi:predicted metal-dependent phosphoesterase TrpH